MFPSFTLFDREIPLYMLCSLVGTLVCGFYCVQQSKRRKLDDNNTIVILLIAAIGVFLGSHLLYALVNFNLIINFFNNLNQINTFSDLISSLGAIFGGGVFYGGMLLGLAFGAAYMKAKKLDFSGYSDVIAPGIPLFHTFGRIGCFLAGCCYGIPCQHGFTYTIAPVPGANGVSRFPVQLVEAAFNLVLFFVLWYFFNKDKFRSHLLLIYLGAYSVARFILEFYRGDVARGKFLALSTSQWISIIVFVAVAALTVKELSHRKKCVNHE